MIFGQNITIIYRTRRAESEVKMQGGQRKRRRRRKVLRLPFCLNILPMQQSACVSAFGWKSLQLSVPHTREPEHSESVSQSPWPRVQTLFVQYDQSELEPVPVQAGAAYEIDKTKLYI